MNVLILKPRLDIMFKKGPVPTQRGDIPPIRQHWKNFVEERVAYHKFQKDNVKVVELPLWQMTPKLVEDFKADLTYIPHKERQNFMAPSSMNVRYYMQTVFPWLFSVDENGWGGGKMFQVKLDDEEKQTNIYEEYKEEYANKNISKFDQPKIDENIKLFPYYVFFPCQLPHDETIQYHSDYSVIECLSELMNFTMHWGIPLVVKGHPVNPASMAPLKEIVLEKQKEKPDMIKWVENVSIHQCVKKCYAVYTVNSGVGMEALLHGKKVFRFGRTDYDEVSYKVEPNYNSLRYNWKTTPDLIQDKYPRFFEKYVQSHIDTRKWVWDRLPR